MKKWFVYGFLSGAAIGGAMALIAAPMRGSATRHKLIEAADPALVRLGGMKVNFKAWVDSTTEAIKQAI